MSPEQAAGRIDLLGPASDVYGLGATLYSLLTNRIPVRGRGVYEVLQKVREGSFPRPRDVTSWLDPALEAVCLKAMAREPGDRYPSAGALAEDIKRWVADQPVTAYREPLARRARRWARRHRSRVVAASAAVVVAITASVASALIVQARRLAIAEKATGDKFRAVALAMSDRTVELAEELKPLAGTRSESVAKVLDLAGDG